MFFVDKVRKTFDLWAVNGRSELMEKEHSYSVLKFLNTVNFENPFSFLDIGCGNGWVVRKIVQIDTCKKAIGIDKSKNMIKNAISKITFPNENYFHTDVESWKYRGNFDFIFSMEVLYYSNDVEASLKKIYKLLRPKGMFFCGTDFYKDNKATSRWAGKMNIPMHLKSKSEWRKLFNEAGFDTITKQIKDRKNRKKWKREFGTLFITGRK